MIAFKINAKVYCLMLILKGAKMESMELILSKRKHIHAASSATLLLSQLP